MKKVNIDFLDFVKTGKFGFLKLGESKMEIINLGFPPEDWLNGETKESSRIWRYGNIELHFNNENDLIGIFTDYVSNIDGGESISISNWWILSNDNTNPDLLSTIKELNSLNLDYIKTTFDIGYIELKLSNGVYFVFDYPDEKPDEEHNNWTMTVIGKK
jgi:hypothetical protein